MSRGSVIEMSSDDGCVRHTMLLMSSWERGVLIVVSGRSGGGLGGGMEVVIDEPFCTKCDGLVHSEGVAGIWDTKRWIPLKRLARCS